MKNKMANKLLAILLSAAMAVTVLPQTSAFATEAGESEIAVEEIAVTDLSEQTGEDSADVESETEEDAEIEAEKTCYISSDMKEQAIEIKEDEAKTVRLTKTEEDDEDYYSPLSLKVIPQKTGVYQYILNGDETYIDKLENTAIDSDHFKAVAGEPVYLVFTYKNIYVEPQDFEIVVTCVDEWEKADSITVGKDAVDITLVKNKLYPIVLNEYGKYTFTNKNESTAVSVYQVTNGLEKISTKDNYNVKKGDIYYLYSEEDTIVTISYGGIESVQIGSWETTGDTIYAFTPSESGMYAFGGFKEIPEDANNHVDGFVATLNKNETYYMKGAPYYPGRSFVMKVGTDPTALGNISYAGYELKQLCYLNSSDKEITYMISGNERQTGYNSYIDLFSGFIGIYNKTKGWTIYDVTRCDPISCQPGETLYFFLLNSENIENKVCVRKMQEDSEKQLSDKTTALTQADPTIVKYIGLSEIKASKKKMELRIQNASDTTRYRIGYADSDGKIEWWLQLPAKDKVISLYESGDYIAIYEEIPESTDSSYQISITERPKVKLDITGNNDVSKENDYTIALPLGADSTWYEINISYSDIENLDIASDFWNIWDSENEHETECGFNTLRNYIYMEKGKTYFFEWYDNLNGTVSFKTLETVDKFGEDVSVDLSEYKRRKMIQFTAPNDAFVKVYLGNNALQNAEFNIYEMNGGKLDTPIQLMQAGKKYLIDIQNNTFSSIFGSFHLTNNTMELKKIQTFQDAINKIGTLEKMTLDSKAAIDSAKTAYAALTTAGKDAVSTEYGFLQAAEAKYAKLVADKAAADKAAADKAAAEKATEEAAKKAAAEEAAKKAAAEAAKKEAVGAENVVGDATYVVAENQTVIYKAPVKKDVTSVKIPETIKINDKDFTVTEIAAGAFKNNKKLTKVTISKNIKVIGKNAFYGCSALKSVTIGSKVTTIGDGAFQGCSKLTKVTIPAKVTKIGKKVFYNCKKLKTITIKTSSLKSVGKSAFKKIAKKASIKVPKKKLTAYKKLLKGKTEADTKIKK